MHNTNPPVHSVKTLAMSTLIASTLASAIFITVVLPAEYALDPTGIGAKLGFTQLAIGADTGSLNAANQASGVGARADEVEIKVPAKSGLEYKFYLEQYAQLQYEWSSGEQPLFFDMHGEPAGGEPGYFQSYGEATASSMKGTLTTPFTGSHGWYWRNRSEEDVVILLKTNGDYNVLGLN